jgi:hypothetical protein
MQAEQNQLDLPLATSWRGVLKMTLVLFFFDARAFFSAGLRLRRWRRLLALDRPEAPPVDRLAAHHLRARGRWALVAAAVLQDEGKAALLLACFIGCFAALNDLDGDNSSRASSRARRGVKFPGRAGSGAITHVQAERH